MDGILKPAVFLHCLGKWPYCGFSLSLEQARQKAGASSWAYMSDTYRDLSEPACWIDRRGGEDGWMGMLVTWSLGVGPWTVMASGLVLLEHLQLPCLLGSAWRR